MKNEPKTISAKKLPKIYRKKYLEKAYKRKLLKKIYVDSDKKLVESLFETEKDKKERDIYILYDVWEKNFIFLEQSLISLFCLHQK